MPSVCWKRCNLMKSPNHEIAKTEELVNTFLSEDFPDLNSGELEKELSGKVSNWEESTLSYLENTNPFEKHRSKLVSAKWDFRAHGGSEESIISDLEGYKSLQPSANVLFWEEKTLAVKKR